MNGEPAGNRDNENLARAFTAANEIEAMAIEAMLESEGVDTAVQSRQIPMYDGIAQVFNPDWGYILVREGDLARARALIDEFMKALEEESGSSAGEVPGEEAGE